MFWDDILSYVVIEPTFRVFILYIFLLVNIFSYSRHIFFINVKKRHFRQYLKKKAFCIFIHDRFEMMKNFILLYLNYPLQFLELLVTSYNAIEEGPDEPDVVALIKKIMHLFKCHCQVRFKLI